jgi:hypothetical protein
VKFSTVSLSSTVHKYTTTKPPLPGPVDVELIPLVPPLAGVEVTMLATATGVPTQPAGKRWAINVIYAIVDN